MSDRPRQPYADMMRTASLLVEKLRPACHRIEIAGSLRRCKPLVSDIEIIAVPVAIPNLIGEPQLKSELDVLLDDLPVNFTKRGTRYQQFWFDGSHLPFYVDLFLQPDPATWGVNMMLRTGSAEFSHRMVTPQSAGGYKPDGYEVRSARVWHNGATVETPNEEDVFDLWKMPFVDPRERE